MDIKATGEHGERELADEKRRDSSTEPRRDVEAELEPHVHFKTFLVVIVREIDLI